MTVSMRSTKSNDSNNRNLTCVAGDSARVFIISVDSRYWSTRKCSHKPVILFFRIVGQIIELYAPMSGLANIFFAVQVSELTIGFAGNAMICPFYVQPSKFVAQGVDVLARGDLIFLSFLQVSNISFACSKDKLVGAF